MAKLIHLLAILAFVLLNAISTEAVSVAPGTGETPPDVIDSDYCDDDDDDDDDDGPTGFPRCPANEIYDPCDTPCLQRRRCGLDWRLIKCAPLKIGDPLCIADCRCIDGYRRNESTGKCVPEDKCPKCFKPNEVYDTCPASCPPRVCGVDERLILCAPQPKPGDENCNPPACRCKSGYYRDNAGNCVPWDKCPKCPKNEVYDPCDAPCPQRTCSFDPRVVRCAAPPKLGDPGCLVGCRCADGYLRNDAGVCVPRNKCNTCKANEKYIDCVETYCLIKDCKDLGFPIKCAEKPKDGSCPGKPGCVCVPGYAKDSRGKCIKNNQCPSCGGDRNAKPGCGINCGKKCTDVGKKGPFKCPPGCRYNGCDCKDGYYYDAQKKRCVKPKDCTCKPNEIFVDCPAGVCSPKTCKEVGFPVPCPDYIDCPGKPGCICVEGYVRNSKGVCVPTTECSSCGGDRNAKPGCGTYCGKRCSDVGKPGPFVCITECQYNGCDCKDGYYYDEKKQRCVKPHDCTKSTPTTCGADEVLVECPISRCNVQTCDQLGFEVACPAIACSGVFGCICKDGYLRNSDGVCIPQDQCPSCGGDPNAQSGCGGNCGKKCSDLGKTGPQICPLSCRLNGCDCKPGYYFDDVKKRCVLPSQCSTTPTCRANEVLSTCANGGCRRRKCIDLDKPILCIDPLVCEPGCICADGYYQDSNGQCVSEEQCKAQTQCPTNEVYDKCEGRCERNARYCNHDPRVVKCAPAPIPAGCLNCRCADGYLRNDADVCILKEECASCGGDKNAKHGCGTYCGKRCSDIGKPGPFVCTTECQYNGCDCKDGYYKDEIKQRCVKPHDCTKSTTTTCGADEVLVECPISRCNVQTCDQLGFEVACPAIACSGVFGCICKDGYLRNSDGVCIPQDQCPPCGGDENAKPGCGGNCGRKCSDIGRTGAIACPLSCRLNGCDCKEGFYFNENTNKCVPPSECTSPPKSCGLNEALVECPQSTCSPQRCDQLGFPIACPMITNCAGVFGCLCKNGYVRNAEGICILSDQCPSCGGDENAQPGCGGNCGKQCSDVGKPKPQICPAACRFNGCDCKDGYYYDDKKMKCVRPGECSITITCRANEVLSTCANGGCRRRKCTDLDKPILCIDPLQCEPGCICAEGYYQDANGNCVSEEQCKIQTGCGGDPNAVPGCGIYCGTKCSDVGKSGPFRCPKILCRLGACDCKKGYFYDSNLKKCVRPKQCTPTCKVNEVFSSCANGGCRRRKCTDIDGPILCIDPRVCTPGCICANGYYKNSKGNCVSKEQCLKEVGCGGDINAVRGCGVNCGKKCSDVGKSGPFKCPKICFKDGCDCKKGYFYDSNLKRCVLPKQCSKCPKNEVYDVCDAPCPARTCSFDPTVVKCASPPKPGSPLCLVGCRCKDGYLRNDAGVCVLKSQCNDQSTRTCGNTDEQEGFLRQASNQMCGKFLYQMVKATPKTSSVSSPYSLLPAFALLYLYSKGNTASEISNLMRFKTNDEIRCAVPKIWDSIKQSDGVEYSFGAKVYFSKDYSLSEPFKNDVKNVLRGDGETIDFSNAPQAADIINQWVSGVTKGKITDIAKPDMFSSLTRLVLANGIYFKGSWQTEFDTQNTQTTSFYVDSSTTKNVQMMQQTNYFDYYEHPDFNARSISIPFKDPEFRFIVILPNENDGLESLLEKLQEGNNLDIATSTWLTGNAVKLSLPKFDITTETDLIGLLKKLGINTIFNGDSELQGMIVPDERLFVSTAVQKATITVDEKGAEATAANVIVIGRSLPPQFIADHPFVYCIKSKKVPLFCGVYYG